MPIWSDFFKLFTYANEKDALAKKRDKNEFSGAGVAQADALQAGGEFGGSSDSNGMFNLRQTYDMIDTTSLNNRTMRYKEYERLRNVPEIEMALTVIADEACLSGGTYVSTPFGNFTLEWLAKNKKDERFLVYCYDFQKKDYSLGWAFNPRLVKKSKTLEIIFDNGQNLIATSDHRILKINGEWTTCGELSFGDELMPFYRLSANQTLTKLKTGQYPRIYTHNKGWINERQFVEEWKSGSTSEEFENANKVSRMIAGNLSVRQIAKIVGRNWRTANGWIKKQGFSLKEIKYLSRNRNSRRVVGIVNGPEIDVYDLSVEKHMCFATDSVIVHNCQKNENGDIFKIECKNEEIVKELNFTMKHRKMLNLNEHSWKWFKNLLINGDWFLEYIINPDKPSDGILKLTPLPPETMYRIETIRGKLVEFQQSKEGPDYKAITSGPVTDQSDTELEQATAVRFAATQICHMRIGDDRKTFYPYGQSLIEPARSPAHQLRLMEDAMVVYRLCLAGDTRVQTKNGWKYIKDIEIGENIFSYSVYNRNIIPSKVIDWKNNGRQKTFKVSSKHMEIVGNETHPIWIERDNIRKYVLIKDLIPKKDKFIISKRNEEIPVKIPSVIIEKWAKLSYIQRIAFRNGNYDNVTILLKNCNINPEITNKFLYSEKKALPYEQAVKICDIFDLDPNQLKIINEEKINLPEYVTEEFARLFGFLIRNGGIRERKYGYRKQLFFLAKKNKKQNKYYFSLLEKFFGKVKFKKDKRSKNPLIGYYVVNSGIGFKILQSLSFNNKRIPNWVFTAPVNIRRAFVEGISNADGCERYTKKGNWLSTIKIRNKDLIADIKEIWSSIGLCSGNLRKINDGKEIMSNEYFFITISDKELPNTEKIFSITEDIVQDVYDITVDNEEHNFIANGTIVHNTRAPERRVFYIDVGQLPPFKAEAFLDRLKDQFRKRKVANNRGVPGANQVEERWQPPAADEDYWIPIRPNANTRIETLPGAQNLGEIDDAIYFRNKLFTALNFPKNYLSNEDANATRITLSAQDVKFARMIERLQSYYENGLMEIAERHLQLRGFPEDSYEDLKIKMTPPSDWRELSRNEVITARYANAGTLKSGQLMSDYDIYRLILKFSNDETEEMMARLKLQKLEDLKLQIVAQNPAILGVGIPGQEQQGQELGSESGGPTPQLSPDGSGSSMPPPAADAPDTPPMAVNEPAPEGQKQPEGQELEEPNEDDIKKFDLGIQDYSSEQDNEDRDRSIGE